MSLVKVANTIVCRNVVLNEVFTLLPKDHTNPQRIQNHPTRTTKRKNQTNLQSTPLP